MRLTKYQKSRLIEFEWNILHNEQDNDNTRWAHFDESDGDAYERLKKLLDIDTDVKDFKILIVATQ